VRDVDTGQSIRRGSSAAESFSLDRRAGAVIIDRSSLARSIGGGGCKYTSLILTLPAIACQSHSADNLSAAVRGADACVAAAEAAAALVVFCSTLATVADDFRCRLAGSGQARYSCRPTVNISNQTAIITRPVAMQMGKTQRVCFTCERVQLSTVC